MQKPLRAARRMVLTADPGQPYGYESKQFKNENSLSNAFKNYLESF